MKKFFLIIIFTCAIQIGYAQMVPGDKDDSPCVSESIAVLSSCLSSNGVDYDMTVDNSGTIYITSGDNTARGMIQSCIAHYDRSVSDCPEAPEVEFLKSNMGKNRNK